MNEISSHNIHEVTVKSVGLVFYSGNTPVALSKQQPVQLMISIEQVTNDLRLGDRISKIALNILNKGLYMILMLCFFVE